MKNKLTVTLLSVMLSGVALAAPADLDTLEVSDVVISDISSLVSADEEVFLSSFKSLLVKEGMTSQLVAEYVQAAIVAFPERSRIIFVTAMAVAPDAHDEIMAVYYELVENAGEGVSDAKGGLGAKDSKDAGNQVLNEEGGDIMSFPAGDIMPQDFNTAGERLPEGSVAGALLSRPSGSFGAFPVGGGEPILGGVDGSTTPAATDTTGVETPPVSNF
ncbi:hypothetical protein OAB00_04250 [Akkermansiaceae bacterium]|nr:hypothetical protein [Akkermansiaceae bacterium]